MTVLTPGEIAHLHRLEKVARLTPRYALVRVPMDVMQLLRRYAREQKKELAA